MANSALDWMDGDDFIFGFAMNDTITGGAGDDTINGGDGTGTAVYAVALGDHRVSATFIGMDVTFTVADTDATMPASPNILGGWGHGGIGVAFEVGFGYESRSAEANPPMEWGTMGRVPS